jgi:hypothetical protein
MIARIVPSQRSTTRIDLHGTIGQRTILIEQWACSHARDLEHILVASRSPCSFISFSFESLKTQIKLQMHTIYDPRGSVDYDAATDKYPNAAATTICCWLMCNLVVMLQYATFDQQYVIKHTVAMTLCEKLAMDIEKSFLLWSQHAKVSPNSLQVYVGKCNPKKIDL